MRLAEARLRLHDGKATALGLMLLACFVLLQLSSGCGGSGGSGSPPPPPPPPPPNPVPTIVSLSPSSANAGGAAFILMIAGNDFIPASTVQWNGNSRAATYSSSSQLQIEVRASDVAGAGSATVSVTNPAPGGGNSGSAEFTISATSNPAPTLASLSPSSVNAGSSGFILTLNGTNFIPKSAIQWNGSVLSTTYLSDTQLEAQIPVANVATAGFAAIMVVNPAPGGGASTPMNFSIGLVPTVVNQAANDLVWDSARQLIYLSVPSLAASNGNTVAALNPLTGAIESSQFAGSEPNALAISHDHQFLYTALNGSSAVQRFTLPALTPDLKYSLGADPNYGPYFAVDLQVAPGLSHTTAVSRGNFVVSPVALGGMAIYDDATQRPAVAEDPSNLYDSLQWGSDTTIYANNAEISSFDLYVLAAGSSGVVQSKDYPSEFTSFYISIHYDIGTKLVYGDDGTVVNPANGQHVGAFGAAGLMVPDSTLNRAYFLGQTQAQHGTASFAIEELNLTTFAPVAEIVVPNVQGNPLHLIRWGTNGLAFNDDAGHVYILNSPFVAADGKPVTTPREYMSPVEPIRHIPRTMQPANVVLRKRGDELKTRIKSYQSQTANPAPTLSAMTPNTVAAGVNSFTLTVRGTNFLSLTQIEWNGTLLLTEYLSSSQLQAQVSASDVATSGSAMVSVYTPGPGGGNSASLPFSIVSNTSTPNPAPVIVSLNPDNVTAGSSGFTINLNVIGNVSASTIVEWNGSPRPSSVAIGFLQVEISASDVATPGYAQVTVTNPGPGGGTSNVAEFQILYQPTIVNQVANDLVWDPINQVMYISVPGSASTHANQVCVLNPMTAAVGNCQPGNGPNRLAISGNSQFLYVGMDGTGSVQRFTLPSLTPDISYSLGSDSGSGELYYALDLQVAPGAPHTTAVSKGTPTIPAATGGITVYDDSTPRPTSAQGWGPTTNEYNSIQWGADANTLYGAGSDLYVLTVDTSGVTLTQSYPGVFWNVGVGDIHYYSPNGLIYCNDGFHVLDPATGLPVGIFEVGGSWPMVPDSNINTVFMLSQYVFQENSNYTIDLFDMTHYVPVTRIPFSTVPNGLNKLGRFIRWGSNGLAFNDPAGNVYLISGRFVSGYRNGDHNRETVHTGSNATARDQGPIRVR